MKKYHYFFIMALMLVCLIVLLAIFDPEFIKATPLANLLANENLSLILVLFESVFAILLLVFQDYYAGKNILLMYSMMEPKWEPGSDRIICTGRNVCRLVSSNGQSEQENIYFVSIDCDLSPGMFFTIPILAKLHSESPCCEITFSKLKIRYRDKNKWINLQLLGNFYSNFLNISGIYSSESTFPICFGLVLNEEQKSALQNSRIKLSFQQRIRTTSGITRKKKVSLLFHSSQNEIYLLEQS